MDCVNDEKRMEKQDAVNESTIDIRIAEKKPEKKASSSLIVIVWPVLGDTLPGQHLSSLIAS